MPQQLETKVGLEARFKMAAVFDDGGDKFVNNLWRPEWYTHAEVCFKKDANSAQSEMAAKSGVEIDYGGSAGVMAYQKEGGGVSASTAGHLWANMEMHKGQCDQITVQKCLYYCYSHTEKFYWQLDMVNTATLDFFYSTVRESAIIDAQITLNPIVQIFDQFQTESCSGPWYRRRCTYGPCTKKAGSPKLTATARIVVDMSLENIAAHSDSPSDYLEGYASVEATASVSIFGVSFDVDLPSTDLMVSNAGVMSPVFFLSSDASLLPRSRISAQQNKQNLGKIKIET